MYRPRTDGSPFDTVERLKGTKVEVGLQRAIEERKGEVFAAREAGANFDPGKVGNRFL